MVRFAGLPCIAVVLFCSLGVPAALAAQEFAPALQRAAEAAAQQTVAPNQPLPIGAVQPPEHRPAALLPLYVSFATLQALDVHATRYALARGAVEANPLMKGLTSSEVGLVAVKAAATAGVILVGEKLWTRNKTGAFILMMATNSAMAWVVQHNYRAMR